MTNFEASRFRRRKVEGLSRDFRGAKKAMTMRPLPGFSRDQRSRIRRYSSGTACIDFGSTDLLASHVNRGPN